MQFQFHVLRQTVSNSAAVLNRPFPIVDSQPTSTYEHYQQVQTISETRQKKRQIMCKDFDLRHLFDTMSKLKV